MQISIKQVYKDVAAKNNISLELIELVGDAVMEEINIWQRKPTSLILDVQCFGRFYGRHQKALSLFETAEELLNNPESVIIGNRDRLIEKKNNFKFILDEYEKYFKAKNLIQEKKYEYYKMVDPERHEQVLKQKEDIKRNS